MIGTAWQGVDAGALKIVGTDTETIVREANVLLTDPAARARMTQAGNPYGDGHAAGRIVAAIRQWMESHPSAK